MKKKREVTDYRLVPVEDDRLEFIASCPTGGSGEGSYITGRIQSMARELLLFRKKYGREF